MTRSSCPAPPASNGNIPADFADEAWRNVAATLEKAGASISDIVSIRQYLTREEYIKTYVAVLNQMVTHEPLGYGTKGLSVEQRVFGLTDWTRDGTLAEYAAVEARNLAPLPGTGQFSMSADVACLFSRDA